MNDVIVVLMENGQVGNSLMVFRYIQQAVDILFIYFFHEEFSSFNIDYDFQAIFHSDNKVKLVFLFFALLKNYPASSIFLRCAYQMS